MGTLHEDLHVFLCAKSEQVGYPEATLATTVTLVTQQVMQPHGGILHDDVIQPYILPIQRSLIPDNFDITDPICKGQILVNASQLLHYAYIS
jgi:hypothetical protein